MNAVKFCKELKVALRKIFIIWYCWNIPLVQTVTGTERVHAIPNSSEVLCLTGLSIQIDRTHVRRNVSSRVVGVIVAWRAVFWEYHGCLLTYIPEGGTRIKLMSYNLRNIFLFLF